MTLNGEVLIAGEAEGRALRLEAPISFWGGVDPATSAIVGAGHPQCGEPIAGVVLVVPELVGSSSSSAVMLELCYAGLAPAALVLGMRDAILPVGVLVAGQMGWNTVPVVVHEELPFRTGDHLRVAIDGSVTCTSSTATRAGDIGPS